MQTNTTGAFRRRSALALTLAPILSGGLALGAHAQTATPVAPQASTEEPGDTIIVTALKTSQRLIDVPAPVTALSANTLTEQNLTNIRDYFNRIPGLQYSGQAVHSLSLRGITTGGATNPTLAVLVDDVPFGSATANGDTDIPDFDPAILSRIEVLRGPQGTLYGAASLGGIIKYVTQDPSTTQFTGRVEAGVSTVAHGGQGNSLRGSLNVPLIKDRVALAVSGFYRRDPAWVDNTDSNTGQFLANANHQRQWGGRAALLLRPVDNLTITLSAIRQRLRTENSGLVDFKSDTDFNSVNADPYSVTRVLGQPSRSQFDVYSARAVLDLGKVQVTSVTGWNVNESVPYQDLTSIFGGLLGRYYPGLSSVFLTNSHRATRFSQELRLSGSSTALDWMLGGFYSVEHANISQTMLLMNASGSLIDTPYVGAGPSTYRELAAFGTVTGHLAPGLDLQVGGRYAHNKQDNLSTVATTGVAQYIFGFSSSEEHRTSESPFTWLVSPSWHITRDVMVYARVANGYRPGGTNTLADGVPGTYRSDRVVNYEAGAKGSVLEGKLDFDLSVFQIDWSRIQLQNTSANELTFTTNGAKARSRGVELAGTVRPWTGGAISGNATFTDAVLTQALPAATDGGSALVGAKGDRLPNSARFTANIGLDQKVRLGEGVSGSLGVNYAWTGKRPGDFLNSLAAAGRERQMLPSYGQLDVRAGVALDAGWSVNVFARNLTDERAVLYAINRNGTTAPYGRYIPPRTVGVQFAGSF
ncbi:outer membrane receptor protein involved in Fe transport [Novosphingobium capsulatum]|uniref:Outer membrane receptor protein involved in Fe transport n=1 Tax=Novosphingobium capsulatum TaxID=13688 RepID=A0ABU1MQL8_9SPHN|nr:TonB-dependent receptor [Novosphingobium capsulatum]MDR6512628.1 outer membrane receptor protein involved in Fe transport [Novosphingobium capsulatum]